MNNSQNSTEADSSQENKPERLSDMTPEQVRNLSAKRYAELMGNLLVENLNNPANHGKTI